MSSNSIYRLIHFNERENVDLIKLMFYFSEQKYEDIQIKLSEWNFYRTWVPFEKLPVLVVDNEYALVNSNTICRFLAKKFKLIGSTDYEQFTSDMVVEQLRKCGENVKEILLETDSSKHSNMENKYINDLLPKTFGELERLLKLNKPKGNFLLGNQLTWADLAIVSGLEWLDDDAKSLLKRYPLLTNHIDFLQSQPKINTWLSQQMPLRVNKII